MKLLKIILGVIVTIICIGIIANILLVIFVNPNQYKADIRDYVEKHTNGQLTITGNFSWSIFPTLGIKAGHLELSNPPGFEQKTFVEINKAIIRLKIFPLLFSKVKVRSVTIDTPKIYLITNADGKNNWDALTNSLSSTTSDAKKDYVGLFLMGFNISKGMLTWTNEKTNQSINISQFELHPENNTFLIQRQFRISFALVGKNPEMSGSFSLMSQALLNPLLQEVVFNNFNLNTKFWNEHNNNNYVYIQGNANANLANQVLQIDILQGDVSGLKFTGNLNIAEFLSKPTTSGHMQVEPFDVKSWLDFNQVGDLSSLQNFQSLSSEFDFKTGNTLKSIELHGTTKVNDIQFHHVRVDNINVGMNLQNGILKFEPINADFYHGKITGNMDIDFNHPVPQIFLQEKMVNVQTQPLMTDFASNQKLKLRGTGNIDLQMTTFGSNLDAVTENLSGNAHLNFNNGVLEGMDIVHLLDTGYALAHMSQGTSLDTGETQFGTLTATVDIHSGILYNKDFYMDAPGFETNGRGTINLNTQDINYALQLTGKNMANFPVPILITGSLVAPSIHLDTDAFLKSISNSKSEKK